jgi:RimJ/RimL family protein N-acetyltransferase
MQSAWRWEADKLTFIICLPPSPSDTTHTELEASLNVVAKTEQITPGKEDAPDRMIGDINLFVSALDDEDDYDFADGQLLPEGKSIHPIVGEINLMIAHKDYRGRGLARSALEAFLDYIRASLPSILREYSLPSENFDSDDETGNTSLLHNKFHEMRFKYLRVKIDKDNVRSIRLFERSGFKKMGGGPNYFGEVEMRLSYAELGLGRGGKSVVYGEEEKM